MSNIVCKYIYYCLTSNKIDMIIILKCAPIDAVGRLAPASSDKIFILIILFDESTKIKSVYHDYKGWSLDSLSERNVQFLNP